MDQGIVTPHDHDVLSGRGNFVNYHAGNEHFRALVRKHKVAYVACPKPQKGKFSRMIVDEIRSRNPPGRFLKQDPATKLWYDIGEKKALDKTRQALREGAPEIMKEIGGVSDEDGPQDEHDLTRRNSSGDELTLDSQKLMHNPLVPPEMHPGNLGAHQVHPGQFMQQPVSNHPYQDAHQGNLTGSMDPPSRMMRNDVVPQQQQQQQPQVTVATIPGSQRIMRNPMAPSSGVVPVRSLAGIRQAMQQQAQRNNAYLQQQYQQQQPQYGGQQQQQTGGMGGYGDMNSRGMGGYPNMNNMPPQMMDQFEPRPIGPGSGGGGGPVNMKNIRTDYEGHEHVGPLPGPMPQRFPKERQKDMHREASDRSINMDKVFSNSGHGKGLDNSVVSTMSLSIGDIVTKLTGEDGTNISGDFTDGDQLAPLFDSSVRLGPEKKQKAPPRSNSSDGKDLGKVLDMSVMSLGGELSVGDGSILRMAGSSADMSFTNVFEETDAD